LRDPEEEEVEEDKEEEEDEETVPSPLEGRGPREAQAQSNLLRGAGSRKSDIDGKTV
jgi:hypothetical protein